MSSPISLDPAIATHLAAINSFDLEAVMATFAADALVIDASREFWGTERIRAWVAKELVGDRVTLEPVEVADNDGLVVVRCRFDGDYDKTNLPDPLIMTNYYRLRDGKIVTLVIIKTTEPTY